MIFMENQELISHKGYIRQCIKNICGIQNVVFCKRSYAEAEKDCIHVRFPDNLDYEYVMHAYADAIHEAFHLRYKTHLVCEEARKVRKDNKLNPKLFYPLSNSIEDYRVNKLGEFDFPGESHVLMLSMRLRARNTSLKNVETLLHLELHGFNYNHGVKFDLNKIKTAKELAIGVVDLGYSEIANIMKECYNIVYL